MFKKLVLVTSLACSLTGCMSESTLAPGSANGNSPKTQGLPTGAALEAFAPRFKIGITQHTDQIAVTPSVAEARLANFASKCIDGKSIKTQRQNNLGMPIGGAMYQLYRSGISNEDGIKRFIISQQLSGAVLTTEAGRRANVQLSTQIVPNGAGGTLLKTTRNKVFFDLSNAAIAWANGTASTCPGLFSG